MLQDVDLQYVNGVLTTGKNVSAPGLTLTATPLPVASGGTGQATAQTLDQIAAPAGNVSLNSHKITSVANGTAGTDAAAFGQVPPTWGPADQGFIAWNYDMPATASGGTTAMVTAGTVYTFGIPLRIATPVTNIVVLLLANGATLTSGQCFGALYPGAGGALTGQTADQATAWGAGAVKVVTMPLAGGPFTMQPGILQVALWFNGTTGPSLFKTAGNATIANAGLAAAASRFGSANTGVTTTAPATLGTISAASNGFWVGLS